jgi:MoaA/NifB/PqqE/SkfB family radical SAM enzyme
VNWKPGELIPLETLEVMQTQPDCSHTELGQQARAESEAAPIALVREADLPSRHDVVSGRVSVIIPFTKPATVEQAVESVLLQDYPKERLEIIVVGQTSSSLARRFPGLVLIDTGPIKQPGKARNLGANRATGEFLLFLDDDCEAQPGWVRESLKELENPHVGAVSGVIKGKSKAVFARCVDYANFGECQAGQRREGRLWTATFGIRKEVFQGLGGFNERVRMQEDIDICFRLNRAGYATVYQPRVRVLHNHGRKTLQALLRYQYEGGSQAGLHIESQYPDLSFRNRLLGKIRSPFVYWPFVVPFSVAGTVAAVRANFGADKSVLFLSPLILLGKLSCHIGVWQWAWGHWIGSSATRQGFMRLLDYALLKTRFRTPRIITLFVTSRCNAKCAHCFYWDNLNKNRDLTFDEFVRLSNSLGRVDKLLVTGGEPFLRRDLASILQLFFEHNHLGAVSIPTNGLQPERTFVMTKEILEVARGRPITISFSIDGTEEYHDRLRGVPGNLKKLQETYYRVRSLQAEYPNLILRVATTVMQQNYDEVVKLFDEIPNILPGVNSPCINLLRGSPYDRNLMLPSNEDIKRIFEHKASKSPGKQGYLRRLADRFTFAAAYENLRQDTQVIPCEAGRVLGVIEDNGNVKPCELLPPVGNLRDGSFDEIWNSPAAREARRRIANKECRCTHECNTFPSLMANPLHAVKLVKAIKS